MSKRNHNVQTPGATPATTPEGDQVEGLASDTQNATDAANAPVQTEATAATDAKPSERPNYAQTPAADIAPDTLTAPVLSRDGWVIPTPKTVARA